MFIPTSAASRPQNPAFCRNVTCLRRVAPVRVVAHAPLRWNRTCSVPAGCTQLCAPGGLAWLSGLRMEGLRSSRRLFQPAWGSRHGACLGRDPWESPHADAGQRGSEVLCGGVSLGRERRGHIGSAASRPAGFQDQPCFPNCPSPAGHGDCRSGFVCVPSARGRKFPSVKLPLPQLLCAQDIVRGQISPESGGWRSINVSPLGRNLSFSLEYGSLK